MIFVDEQINNNRVCYTKKEANPKIKNIKFNGKNLQIEGKIMG